MRQGETIGLGLDILRVFSSAAGTLITHFLSVKKIQRSTMSENYFLLDRQTRLKCLYSFAVDWAQSTN